MSAPSLFASFVGAVRFFTRLRIPGAVGQDAVALERAIGFFPAAGLLVGGVAALAFASSVLVLPKTLAVALAIGVAIVFTGAIHEDGWNDTVDGFGSSVDRAEILAIMRDSQLRSSAFICSISLRLNRRWVALMLQPSPARHSPV